MIKSGLAFHCHHDVLFEYVYDSDERVRFIKENKPKGEQKLRLKLFQMIPDELIPSRDSSAWEAYDKARKAYDKARKACDKAWEAYDKTRKAYDKAWEAYDKARKARDKAWEARDKAWEAYSKAWKVYCKKHHKELEKLHTNLCPDCPWDGKTIFCT